MKRLCVDAGLANAAASKCLANAMGIGAGDGGMAHPDLLVGPALLRPARRDRLAKQRPLGAIGNATGISEIGRHIPPLDTEFRMRPVVGGKCECPARHDRRKSIRAFTKPGKALRERLAA